MNGDVPMNFDNIPRELKELDRWVCWRWEERMQKDGTPDDPAKTPINPTTGGRAMSNNPATWGTFEDAVEAANRGRVKDIDVCGIGFMFNGDGIIGVDIDHCRDAGTGQLTDQAKDIISALDSYTEFSQSGKGIHIICYGKLPEGGRRKSCVEMYATGRYFIVTGNILDDAHTSIEERTAELAAVHEKYINAKKTEKSVQKTSKSVNNGPVFVSDDEIIEIALNAKNGSLFADLMNGNWKGAYNSQSEADLALCNMLAFYTGKDTSMMDSIYRRSGLYRDKWDERRGDGGTYGQITIAKAIADCKEVYTPPRPKSEVAPMLEAPEFDSGIDQLGEPPPEQLPDWITGPYNDMWNAERMKEKYGDIIRYNVKKGWHIYNGKVWQEDVLGQIRALADRTILDLYKYQDLIKHYDAVHETKRNKEFHKWLCASRNAGKKDNMLREAEALEGIASLPEWFDKDKYLLNCQNGTLDLRTGKLHPHERTQLITRIIDIEYDPDAKTKIWEGFLNRIFDGKKDLIEFIQRAIGYTLTGSIKEQCIFILHGIGKNGKSTFIETIRSIFGDYVRKVSDKVFTSKENFYNSMGEIARLPGARMCTTDEPNEGAKLEEGLVKQVTGGAPLLAKFLYKEPFEFVPEFKLWMEANHKPVITGTDLGIWRRIRLIPFNVVIPPDERDVDLPEKLKAELPGILAWMVRGCMMWQKDGLMEPEVVLVATDEYRNEMDNLQVFLDECVAPEPGSSVKSGDLYSIYSAWCLENGARPISSTKLAMKLQDRGYKKDRSRVARYWEDIKFTDAGKNFLHLKYEGKKQHENDDEGLPINWDDIGKTK
jgi:putative DNA primase/helicase